MPHNPATPPPGSPPSRGGRDAPSQVGTVGAMRARDVSRPEADDLAEAEQRVQVVSRAPARRANPPSGQSSERGGSTPEDS
jgi:hypothetical protein